MKTLNNGIYPTGTSHFTYSYIEDNFVLPLLKRQKTDLYLSIPWGDNMTPLLLNKINFLPLVGVFDIRVLGFTSRILLLLGQQFESLSQLKGSYKLIPVSCIHPFCLKL